MTNSHQITPVILCGGSGSRLWPLSRSSYPKQFLTFTEKKTLFQQAFKRICQLKNPLIKFNDAMVVTNEEHRFLVLEQLREIDIADIDTWLLDRLADMIEGGGFKSND